MSWTLMPVSIDTLAKACAKRGLEVTGTLSYALALASACETAPRNAIEL